MNCIFCEIINKKIPCAKIYEDDLVIAFLDIKPINPGHTLIVPKKHSENLAEMDNTDIETAFNTAKKLAQKICKAVNATSFNIGMNNGKEAGQLVMHSHIHIIPRFPNDGLRHWPGKEARNLEEIKNKIIENIE